MIFCDGKNMKYPKIIPRILLASFIVVIAACSNHQPVNTILPSDITELKQLPRVTAKSFDLDLRLERNHAMMISETKSGKMGELLRFTKLKEFVYPSSYGLPKIDTDGLLPVAPATPKGYTDTKVGQTVDLVAKRENGLIILEGNVINTYVEEFYQGVHGEVSTPVMIPSKGIFKTSYVTVTENKQYSPKIAKVTYPFMIRVIPNKKYSVFLTDDIKLLVKVDVK